GEYMLELLPAGIVGVMPGLAIVDVLQRIWELGRAGRLAEAYEHFGRIHPWIAYSLQSMESYNYLEKDLLIRRGLLRASHPRHPPRPPDTRPSARAASVRAGAAARGARPAPGGGGGPTRRGRAGGSPAAGGILGAWRHERPGAAARPRPHPRLPGPRARARR